MFKLNMIFEIRYVFTLVVAPDQEEEVLSRVQSNVRSSNLSWKSIKFTRMQNMFCTNSLMSERNVKKAFEGLVPDHVRVEMWKMVRIN